MNSPKQTGIPKWIELTKKYIGRNNPRAIRRSVAITTTASVLGGSVVVVGLLVALSVDSLDAQWRQLCEFAALCGFVLSAFANWSRTSTLMAAYLSEHAHCVDAQLEESALSEEIPEIVEESLEHAISQGELDNVFDSSMLKDIKAARSRVVTAVRRINWSIMASEAADARCEEEMLSAH